MKQPNVTPLREMQFILYARKGGQTYTQIKAGIDKVRKIEGTYKGQGISTNTISRIVGKKYSKDYQKQIKRTWKLYEQAKRVDDGSEKFDRMYKAVVKKTKYSQRAAAITEIDGKTVVTST